MIKEKNKLNSHPPFQPFPPFLNFKKNSNSEVPLYFSKFENRSWMAIGRTTMDLPPLRADAFKQKFVI